MTLDVQPVLVEGRIRIPYRWPSGRHGDRFLRALRDEGRLLGLRCPQTGRVLVPPPPARPDRAVTEEDWVEVGPGGVVETFTVRGEEVLALVRPDGADTALLHRLVDVAPAAVRVGLRVRAVLAGQRTGSILDLRGFAPEPEAAS